MESQNFPTIKTVIVVIFLVAIIGLATFCGISKAIEERKQIKRTSEKIEQGIICPKSFNITIHNKKTGEVVPCEVVINLNMEELRDFIKRVTD